MKSYIVDFRHGLKYASENREPYLRDLSLIFLQEIVAARLNISSV